MSKVRLSIAACTLRNGRATVSKDLNFETMLNPSSYKHNLNITYNRTTALGKASQDVKFNTAGGDTLSFDLLIDATGAVEPVTPDGSVLKRIKFLKKVAYDYDGGKHEPNVVRVLWGGFLFYGRLTSMTIDYTLFKPSGEPLRAKLGLTFVGSMSSKEESLQSKRSSPDLTHVVEFKAGDSLPLLCQRIYDDSSYYTAVARYNGITNFRAIAPGRKLLFPPLR